MIIIKRIPRIRNTKSQPSIDFLEGINAKLFSIQRKLDKKYRQLLKSNSSPDLEEFKRQLLKIGNYARKKKKVFMTKHISQHTHLKDKI